MRKMLIPIMLLLISLTGCNFIERIKGELFVDTEALEQARLDSIKQAELINAQMIEEAQLARERAIQDSIQRARDLAARNRYHVIIGSFRVPSNADNFQQQVVAMGFTSPKILDAPNGFRLVSIGGFETYSRATNEILRVNRAREEPIEMWVYEAHR